MKLKNFVAQLQAIAEKSPESEVLAGFKDEDGEYSYHDATEIYTGFVNAFPKDNAPLIILLDKDPSMSG